MPRILSSTPTAGAKLLFKLLTPHYLCPPTSNGYLVESEESIGNDIKPLPLYVPRLYSPQGDNAMYLCASEFLNQGR